MAMQSQQKVFIYLSLCILLCIKRFAFIYLILFVCEVDKKYTKKTPYSLKILFKYAAEFSYYIELELESVEVFFSPSLCLVSTVLERPVCFQ